MNRRRFLALTAAGITLTAIGGYKYMGVNEMELQPKKEGKILADLHTHPANYKCKEDTLEALTFGITGLAFINHGNQNKILTYEEGVGLFSDVEEIDIGKFAKVTYDGKTGYLLKAQEFTADFHILALGIETYLPNIQDARQAVEAARKQNAIVILNHPYVTNNDHPIVKYRLITEEEEAKARELCEMVDEVEVFNAQNIRTYMPGIPNMNEANDAAKILAQHCGKKGTAASDAHLRLEQLGIAGIYLSDQHLCLEAIREALKNQNFERAEQYVNRLSFIKGMFIG